MSNALIPQTILGASEPQREVVHPRVVPQQSGVLDTLQRPFRDLRISVTDKCNFRCTYCMPREVFDSHYQFLAHSQLLSFEEITRVAKVSLNLGVNKLRLTGGEPLLRRDIEQLIAMLAALRTPHGEAPEIALTTNGTLLAKKAEQLKEAGLDRVTVSLDALESRRFSHLSDSNVAVETVLAGIDRAAQVGLAPVKVNMVVRKGLNDDQILPMVEHFRHTPHILRFIEYMDVGNTNGWNLAEVVTGKAIHDRIHAHYPLVATDANYVGEVAGRYTFADGAGEIGLITSVSRPFCSACTRMRLSPEGRLFLCLFGSKGVDIRQLLRDGATDSELAGFMSSTWRQRSDQYSAVRHLATSTERDKVEMSYIGG